jgi:hypothetical protein
VASAGDIEPIQTLSTDLVFSNASASSDATSLPQLVSSGDPPTSNATAYSTTAAPSTESVAEDPHQDVKSTSLPTSSSLTVPSITTDDPSPASMDTDAGKDGTESIDNANSMQVDVKNRQKSQSSSTDVAVVAPPAWLVAVNMDVYLLGCSDATAWKELIETLYKFERLNTLNGVRRYNFIKDCY